VRLGSRDILRINVAYKAKYGDMPGHLTGRNIRKEVDPSASK
jgi:hypothetical protein